MSVFKYLGNSTYCKSKYASNLLLLMLISCLILTCFTLPLKSGAFHHYIGEPLSYRNNSNVLRTDETILDELDDYLYSSSNQNFKENKYISQKKSPAQIVRPPKDLDSDGNKIVDELEKKIIDKSVSEVDVLVGFDHKPTISDKKFIEGLGGTWKRAFETVWVASVKIPVNVLEIVGNNPGISIIEENSEGQPLLQYSASQIRARGATWNELTSLGNKITGKSEYSTAVLDTGVDITHPDLASRCIAWKDFVGVKAGVPNDEYSTYSDYGHHGTHVASIISGQGNMSRENYIPVTKSGMIPQTPGFALYGPAFELNGGFLGNHYVNINVSQYCSTHASN